MAVSVCVVISFISISGVTLLSTLSVREFARLPAAMVEAGRDRLGVPGSMPEIDLLRRLARQANCATTTATLRLAPATALEWVGTL
jgi:hypothetical protein